MHIIIFGLEVVCDVRHGGALKAGDARRGCNIFPQSRLTGQTDRAARQGEGVHRLHALYLTGGRTDNGPGGPEREVNVRGSLFGGGRRGSADWLSERELDFGGRGLLRCGHHSGRLIQSKIQISLGPLQLSIISSLGLFNC